MTSRRKQPTKAKPARAHDIVDRATKQPSSLSPPKPVLTNRFAIVLDNSGSMRWACAKEHGHGDHDPVSGDAELCDALDAHAEMRRVKR